MAQNWLTVFRSSWKQNLLEGQMYAYTILISVFHSNCNFKPKGCSYESQNFLIRVSTTPPNLSPQKRPFGMLGPKHKLEYKCTNVFALVSAVVQHCTIPFDGTHARTHAHAHTHTHMHVHAHAHAHTHTHTHTHIHDMHGHMYTSAATATNLFLLCCPGVKERPLDPYVEPTV